MLQYEQSVFLETHLEVIVIGNLFNITPFNERVNLKIKIHGKLGTKFERLSLLGFKFDETAFKIHHLNTFPTIENSSNMALLSHVFKEYSGNTKQMGTSSLETFQKILTN